MLRPSSRVMATRCPDSVLVLHPPRSSLQHHRRRSPLGPQALQVSPAASTRTSRWYTSASAGPLESIAFRSRNAARDVGSATRSAGDEPVTCAGMSRLSAASITSSTSRRRRQEWPAAVGQCERFLHDQYFTRVETQVPSDTPGARAFRDSASQQVDVGHRYRKHLTTGGRGSSEPQMRGSQASPSRRNVTNAHHATARHGQCSAGNRHRRPPCRPLRA